jgi:hypothetical protein
MATKVHPPSRHHCYNVDDLVPLLEQMGNAVFDILEHHAANVCGLKSEEGMDRPTLKS